jgi:hypothetical protein
MHENREISCASWSNDQDRSAKAINRTAGVHAQEKSDCTVVRKRSIVAVLYAFDKGLGRWPLSAETELLDHAEA